ncbi:MAG: ATP-binding protein [Nitrososphaerota archaeon]
MEKSKIAMMLSLASIFVGTLVAIGWVLDIEPLKSIIPNAVTMKFSTAICFVFSGITVFFLARYRQGKTGVAQIAIPISGLVIFLFMASSLFATVLSLDAGIRNVLVKEESGAVSTVLPGRPSIPTMINFILIVGAGMLALSETRFKRFFPYVGHAVTTIGVISLAGYATNQSTLYYYYPNVSTAMALHTSMLFTMLGIALFFLKADTKLEYVTSVKIRTKLIFLFSASSIIPLLFIFSLILDQIESFPNDKQLITDMIVIMSSTVIAVSIFSFLISRAISKPILNLYDTAQKISKGDISAKADERTNDEIGNLGKILNQMVGNITKSGRLSAIGDLAARLAHDIRNPLSIIKANLELLQKSALENQSEKSEQRVTAIFRALDRIAYQIDSVMDFVRVRPLNITKTSILEILSLATRTTPIPENIQIVLPENDVDIECDKKQLEVVFSNMMMNSAQAIVGNGTVTINLKDANDRIIIDIIDTGSGITEENLIKIFEPLFTTKQTGTGLGLVTCKNIIQQHHGTISVKNNPTTFTIDLPVNQ